MQAFLRRHFILEKSFLYNVLAIAVPIALQNMISFGVAVTDSVMLGSLGDVAISAANLGGQPFSILMSVGFGLSSGGSVLIAQYGLVHISQMADRFVKRASDVLKVGDVVTVRVLSVDKEKKRIALTMRKAKA